MLWVQRLHHVSRMLLLLYKNSIIKLYLVSVITAMFFVKTLPVDYSWALQEIRSCELFA